MDFGWPAGPMSPPRGPGSDLNLLGDGLLIDLDDKTLQVRARERLGPSPAPRAHPRPAPTHGASRLGAEQLAPPPCRDAALLLRSHRRRPSPPLPQCLMGGPSAAFASLSGGASGSGAGPAGHLVGAGSSGAKRDREEEAAGASGCPCAASSRSGFVFVRGKGARAGCCWRAFRRPCLRFLPRRRAVFFIIWQQPDPRRRQRAPAALTAS